MLLYIYKHMYTKYYVQITNIRVSYQLSISKSHVIKSNFEYKFVIKLNLNLFLFPFKKEVNKLASSLIGSWDFSKEVSAQILCRFVYFGGVFFNKKCRRRESKLFRSTSTCWPMSWIRKHTRGFTQVSYIVVPIFFLCST